MPWKVHLARHIDEAGDAHGAVDHETGHVLAELGELELKKIVAKNRNVVDVVVEVRDALIHRGRRHFLVPLRDGLHDIAVQLVIEALHVAIEALDRVSIVLGGRRHILFFGRVFGCGCCGRCRILSLVGVGRAAPQQETCQTKAGDLDRANG